MKLDVRCLKCGSIKYYMKSAVLPEKNQVIKLHLGLYYLKVCIDCGFTEMYAAAIIDKEKDTGKESVLNEALNPEI